MENNRIAIVAYRAEDTNTNDSDEEVIGENSFFVVEGPGRAETVIEAVSAKITEDIELCGFIYWSMSIAPAGLESTYASYRQRYSPEVHLFCWSERDKEEVSARLKAAILDKMAARAEKLKEARERQQRDWAAEREGRERNALLELIKKYPDLARETVGAAN